MIHSNPKLILVDGSSYLFRAYYALPPLTNSKGKATGAILGVINMLKKLVKTYDPEWMAVIFDSKEPTFRHQLFSTYKANRSKMPEDLSEQLFYLLEIIPALGFFVLQMPGNEADDLIGTLVKKLTKQGIFSIISTGDKDLTQLVNENVVIVNTMTDVVLDVQGVINKFGVPPHLIIDYLMLIGDQVDNIPGVPNVGPKTAVKWLEKYQNIDGILQHSHEIAGKVGESLRSSISNFPLYKKLVTIDTNLDININIDDLNIKTRNIPKLVDLFTELEFNSWLKELANIQSKPIVISDVNNIIKTDLNCWINKLAQAEVFSLHLQTTSIDPMIAKIQGLYLAVVDTYCYIDFIDINLNFLNTLSTLLLDPKKIKIFYNLKYIMQVLENYNIYIRPPFYDVTLESYILNSLNKLQLDPTKQLEAKHILDMHNNLWPQICGSPSLERLLVTIELPLLTVLQKMERQGVLIDVKKLEQQGIVIQERIIILENQVYSLAGQVFNLNSPKQLQEIFYTKLGLPILQKTPTGQPSTSEQVLQELAVAHGCYTVDAPCDCGCQNDK